MRNLLYIVTPGLKASTASSVILLLCVALTLTRTARAQRDAEAPRWPSEELHAEARAHAAILWSRILNHCGQYFYYGGSGLDGHTPDGQPQEFSVPGGDIVEYRDVRTGVIPPPSLSAAEQLNSEGVEQMGTAVMVSKVYRLGGTAALKWGPFSNGPLSDIPASWLANPGSLTSVFAKQIGPLAGEPGFGGSIVVHMARKNGRWFYSTVPEIGYLGSPEEGLKIFPKNWKQVKCGAMPDQGPQANSAP